MLFSILADFNNSVVWMASARLMIFHFSNLFKDLTKCPLSELVSLSLSCFIALFSSLARSKYLSLFSFSLIFPLWSARTAKFTIRQVFSILLLLLLNTTRSGILVGIRWYVCISKSSRTLCISFSRTGSGLCTYNLAVRSYLNFLHNSHWITFTTQPSLVLYSFCTSLMHSLNMWWIVSTLPSHNLHLLVCCVFFPLTWLIFVLLLE